MKCRCSPKINIENCKENAIENQQKILECAKFLLKTIFFYNLQQFPKILTEANSDKKIFEVRNISLYCTWK